MKAIVSFAVFFYAAFAMADANFGKQIEFYKVDGKPRFGVQMFEDRMAMTFTVNGFDLAQRRTVISVSVRLMNKATGETLSDIIQLANFPNGAVLTGTQAFTLSIKGPAATQTVDGLATSAMILSTIEEGGSVNTSYIDLASYCSSAKDHFLNLDTGVTGCTGQ